jgi:hypothetical protein
VTFTHRLYMGKHTVALAPQLPAKEKSMQVDLPDVVAEVTEAFERYEQALVTNDVATLDSLFHNDARTIRYGIAENLYGHAEVAQFRARRLPLNLARTRSRTVITTYGRDFAVASTLFYRDSAAGKVGRQMQSWVRLAVGWRIVAAHVSLINAPAQDEPAGSPGPPGRRE